MLYVVLLSWLSALIKNQGTFSDYHLKAGNTLNDEHLVGGYVTNGSYRGLFHTLIGNGRDNGSGSRLSKN